MCFLVQQLRTEKKVDICSMVRKLRSQRVGMIEKYVSELKSCGSPLSNRFSPSSRRNTSFCTGRSSTTPICTSCRWRVSWCPIEWGRRRRRQTNSINIFLRTFSGTRGVSTSTTAPITTTQLQFIDSRLVKGEESGWVGRDTAYCICVKIYHLRGVTCTTIWVGGEVVKLFRI